MIKIFSGADRTRFSQDFDQMFRARAAVFKDRLGWEVAVEDGLEIDRYDRCDDTVYVVASDADGHLTGSLRLLPTTGDTMLRYEFADFFDEPVDVESPTAWECTRFCVHPPRRGERAEAMRQVSSDLLIGLCDLCLTSGIEHIVGLYDARMTRIYQRIGWTPDLLAESHSARGHLVVGLWEATPRALERMQALSVRSRTLPLRQAA
ncbi:acyl-homoserine-lactone synthase [Methylobacterium sp. Leaf118]|uniref:acyl-homoserine-lactone synthase n=1 Tax=Methylobacterium sp. Leaf118 TaxID=2876562 RepID=UPI0022B7D4A0|nr:acyl-homoserine-lactone synthase [Methylobacterium sp. Leaf118]